MDNGPYYLLLIVPLSSISDQIRSDHPLDISAAHGAVVQAGGTAGAGEEMSAGKEHDLRWQLQITNIANKYFYKMR